MNPAIYVSLHKKQALIGGGYFLKRELWLEYIDFITRRKLKLPPRIGINYTSDPYFLINI